MCAGCLGSRWCWVCEGAGVLPDTTAATCPRCLGSRVCSVCCGELVETMRAAGLHRSAGVQQPRDRDVMHQERVRALAG